MSTRETGRAQETEPVGQIVTLDRYSPALHGISIEIGRQGVKTTLHASKEADEKVFSALKKALEKGGRFQKPMGFGENEYTQKVYVDPLDGVEFAVQQPEFQAVAEEQLPVMAEKQAAAQEAFRLGHEAQAARSSAQKAADQAAVEAERKKIQNM
ncbi:hypothetical protein HYV73_04170 [Candidatus Uhrbacteria bacterium]|nr:hypothetical protein [Candidatus Uhrbacteria bacterium]